MAEKGEGPPRGKWTRIRKLGRTPTPPHFIHPAERGGVARGTARVPVAEGPLDLETAVGGAKEWLRDSWYGKECSRSTG